MLQRPSPHVPRCRQSLSHGRLQVFSQAGWTFKGKAFLTGHELLTESRRTLCCNPASRPAANHPCRQKGEIPQPWSPRFSPPPARTEGNLMYSDQVPAMVQDLDQVLQLCSALPHACIPAQGGVSGVCEGFGLVASATVRMYYGPPQYTGDLRGEHTGGHKSFPPLSPTGHFSSEISHH